MAHFETKQIMQKLLPLLYCTLLAYSSSSSVDAQNPRQGPIVDVNYAQFQGAFDPETNVTNFLGIRYATSPTGRSCFQLCFVTWTEYISIYRWPAFSCSPIPYAYQWGATSGHRTPRMCSRVSYWLGGLPIPQVSIPCYLNFQPSLLVFLRFM